MADKRLIHVPLDELATGDREVLGSLYPHKGKIYRWVKNAGITALTLKATCLSRLTSVVDNIDTRVIAPSGAGTSTGAVIVPAGVPMAAIAASGAATGDHGWIMAKGVTKACVQQLTTALAVGDYAIASSTYDAAWASVHKPTADSASTANIYARKVMLMQSVATTGAATAVSAIVDVQCL